MYCKHLPLKFSLTSVRFWTIMWPEGGNSFIPGVSNASCMHSLSCRLTGTVYRKRSLKGYLHGTLFNPKSKTHETRAYQGWCRAAHLLLWHFSHCALSRCNVVCMPYNKHWVERWSGQCLMSTLILSIHTLCMNTYGIFQCLIFNVNNTTTYWQDKNAQDHFLKTERKFMARLTVYFIKSWVHVLGLHENDKLSF